MTNIKSYIKNLLLSFGELIFILTILTVFYYYNLISYNTFKVFELISLLIIIFINSNLFKRKNNLKRFISGILFILPYIFFSIIVALIFKEFNIKLFIYYFIILFISLLGSFFQKKKDD